MDLDMCLPVQFFTFFYRIVIKNKIQRCDPIYWKKKIDVIVFFYRRTCVTAGTLILYKICWFRCSKLHIEYAHYFQRHQWKLWEEPTTATVASHLKQRPRELKSYALWVRISLSVVTWKYHLLFTCAMFDTATTVTYNYKSDSVLQADHRGWARKCVMSKASRTLPCHCYIQVILLLICPISREIKIDA